MAALPVVEPDTRLVWEHPAPDGLMWYEIQVDGRTARTVPRLSAGIACGDLAMSPGIHEIRVRALTGCAVSEFSSPILIDYHTPIAAPTNLRLEPANPILNPLEHPCTL